MKPILAGYQINDEPLFESDQTIVFKGTRIHDAAPVILKFLKDPHPSPSQISHLKHEFEILQRIDSPHIGHAYALEKIQNSFVIVLELVNGNTLANILLNKKKFQLREFLEWAIRITEGIAAIHLHQIVHNDINPSNIMIDVGRKEAKIIDFNLSTTLPKNWIPMMNPSQLHGTLPYLSPEQTGRMNRGIDYRTDFYSLGVTFYQLLTGHLPFESEDPFELILFHIAFLPKTPHEIEPSIPEVVSSIVMKLLAKKAEERYQNAEGLLYDLRYCLNQLVKTGTISPFPLGSKDLSSYFQISEELYGRDKEVKILLDIYERASKGPVELLLVSGYAGIGKSSLVHEIHKQVVKKRGYFVSGKFEQIKHNIPYEGFIEALSDLIDQILTEDEERIGQIKTRIQAVLGDLGQIIIDVIPNLAIIIGEQPQVKELDPMGSQNRFRNTFQRFIAALPTTDHPLTIFLDDLQWADNPSLRLLEALLTSHSCRHLFIIGAYRSNEVTLIHPLMVSLEELKKQNIVCESIELTPLEKIHLEELLAQTLHQEMSAVSALAETCYEKTGGNPFFLKQLLQQLYKEQLIEFDSQQNQWNWDLDKIKEKKITDNVVDLMIEKIGDLSLEAQEVIKIAACIGNQFDSEILSALDQKDTDLIDMYLQELRKENFIIKKGIDEETHSFQFVHDKIQQAAYQLVGEEERKEANIAIARLLLQRTPEEKLNEELFNILNHFNAGIDSQIPPIERKKLAELNLRAARMAKSAAAYEAALKYTEYSIQCSQENWTSHAEDDQTTIFELYVLAAECAFLCSKIDLMEKYSEIALKYTKDPLDEYQITQIKMQYLFSELKYQEAIGVAITLLGKLGVKISSNPNRFDALILILKTRYLLWGKKISDLINLPKMTDAKQQLIMKVLVWTIYSTTFSDNPYFYAIFTSLAVNLSLNYGNSEESPIAYEVYAVLCCGPLKAIEQGYGFGQLAIKLVEEAKDKARKTRVCFSNYALVQPLKHSLREILPKLLENYEDGLDSGQVYYGRLSISYYYDYSVFAGVSIKELLDRIVIHENQFINTDKSFYLSLLLTHQLILTLSEEENTINSATNKLFDESELVASFRGFNAGPYLFLIHFHQFYLNFLFEDYAEAKRYQEQCDFYEENSAVLSAFCYTVFSTTLKSLLLLNGYAEATPKEKHRIQKAVKANQKKLKRSAELSPQNHLHRYYLVEAEWTAKVLKQSSHALKLYNKAINLANQNKFVNDEGLANELLAKHFITQRKEKIAKIFLEEALYCYSLWGAEAKVAHLKSKYEHLVGSTSPEERPISSPHFSIKGTTRPSTKLLTSVSTTYNPQTTIFDVESILKFSQTLSSTVELTDLLKKLMRIVLENAGAQKSYLLFGKEGKFYIEAEGNINQEERILESIEPSSEIIPVSVINYVARAKESVILDDALHLNRFNDPYISKNQVKSILCMPLLNQGTLSGILYLENNLAEGVFTKDRIDLLNLLSSQIAVSIDNARLYNNTVLLNKNLNSLNQSYEKLVPQDFLTLLERKSIIDVSLGDHIEKNMTVLFADIRNFTALSEKMDPEKNFHFINSFLQVMAPLIRKHQGFIDKYIGGAIMALFPNNADDAVRCAIEMQDALTQYNSMQQPMEPVDIGIGINTGLLMLGTIGEENRFGVTVISDAVNVASRVESLTLAYGEKILITEATFKNLLIPEDYEIEMIGSTAIKGKAKEILLYKVRESHSKNPLASVVKQ